jgi:simple sugar transport system ATP-binding protein
MECADRIMVIRHGKVVGEVTEKAAIISCNDGWAPVGQVQRKSPGDVVLDVKNLTIKNRNQKIEVDDISFEVKAGEILGVAGVQGNGQTELVRCLTGLTKAESGKISILGQEIAHSNPRVITELGVAHIPEDRQKDGLVLPSPVQDNLFETYYKPFKGSLSAKVVEDLTTSACIDIRTQHFFNGHELGRQSAK